MSLFEFIKMISSNRKLIASLSKNDFKTRYAGSYLGIIWAFVQPMVTIVVYWFVFSVGLRAGTINDFPFALWLMAGIVPWFFFQEALNSGTNALIEYSYLVKKVVFHIDILPLVKIVSALFVHVFFIVFVTVVYALNGYLPTPYTLQVIYYSFSLICLVIGMAYFTSAIMVFFRDLNQLINVVLQVGIWMTPIMWNIEMIPARWQWIFNLNPVYYIVKGYRDSFIYHEWFWQHPKTTVYYWALTVLMFVIGTKIFRSLKIHFADVL